MISDRNQINKCPQIFTIIVQCVNHKCYAINQRKQDTRLEGEREVQVLEEDPVICEVQGAF